MKTEFSLTKKVVAIVFCPQSDHRDDPRFERSTCHGWREA